VKLIFAAAASAVVLLAGAPALAQAGFFGAPVNAYATVGYTRLSTELEGTGAFSGQEADLNLGAATGRVGARFGGFLGAEAELSFGVQDEDFSRTGSVGGVTARSEGSVELKSQVAAFALAFIPVAPNADVFARAGYGRLETDVEERISAGSFNTVDSGTREANFWAYGAGGQHFFDGVNGVRGEYTRYDLEEDGAEFDSLSIAYVRKF